jgi:hypothetical protein
MGEDIKLSETGSSRAPAAPALNSPALLVDSFVCVRKRIPQLSVDWRQGQDWRSLLSRLPQRAIA